MLSYRQQTMPGIPSTNRTSETDVEIQQCHPGNIDFVALTVNGQSRNNKNKYINFTCHKSSSSSITWLLRSITTKFVIPLNSNKKKKRKKKYGSIVRFFLISIVIPFLLTFRYIIQMKHHFAETPSQPLQVVLPITSDTLKVPSTEIVTPSTSTNSSTFKKKNEVHNNDNKNNNYFTIRSFDLPESAVPPSTTTLIKEKKSVKIKNRITKEEESNFTNNSLNNSLILKSDPFKNDKDLLKKDQQLSNGKENSSNATSSHVNIATNNSINNTNTYNNRDINTNSNNFTAQLLIRKPSRFAVAYTIHVKKYQPPSTRSDNDNTTGTGSTTTNNNHYEYHHHLLYNVLVNTEIMRSLNSTVDTIIFFRIHAKTTRREDDSTNNSRSTSDDDDDNDDDVVLEYLPADIIHLLERKNIKYRYITTETDAEYYNNHNYIGDKDTNKLDTPVDMTLYDSFRVLKLIQYKRVLVLDCTKLMIRSNIDYIFHWSMASSSSPLSSSSPSIPIQENMIFLQNKDTNNEYLQLETGVFMLTPGKTKYQQFLNLLRIASQSNIDIAAFNKRTRAYQTLLESSSSLSLLLKSSKSWTNFKKMLYYWSLFYCEQSVSVVITMDGGDGLKITNFDPSKQRVTERNNIKFKNQQQHKPCWAGYDLIPKIPNDCTRNNTSPTIHFPFIHDFVYFANYTEKPWIQGPPSDVDWNDSNANNVISPTHHWYTYLSRSNTKYNLGIDIQTWNNTDATIVAANTWIASEPGIDFKPPPELLSIYRPKRAKKSSMNHRRTRFAYAYVVGGCNPDQPSYRNYIYDIMVSTYMQRIEHSTADVIVFVQMSYQSTYTTLPDYDRALLRSMEIRVHCIPKASDESFYRIMLDKFRILELTSYERVLFLDSDVMSLGNLDYLFELSVSRKLKQNIVFTGKGEPANGGTFMLTPKEGKFDELLYIIREKEVRGLTLEFPHWNETIGWGQVLDGTNHYYRTLAGGKGTLWNFHGAFADQGLLYHWVKFHEQDVSIIFHNAIQNWGRRKQATTATDNKNNNTDSDTSVNVVVVVLEQTLNLSTFMDSFNVTKRTCFKGYLGGKPCMAPQSDFIHFTGTNKPWLIGPPENYNDYHNVVQYDSPGIQWFYILDQINTDLRLGIDFTNWERDIRPSLGLYPKFGEAARTVYRSSVDYRKNRKRSRRHR